MVELQIAPLGKDGDAIDIRRDLSDACHVTLLKRIVERPFYFGTSGHTPPKQPEPGWP
jgi:hypothetical protein